MQQHLAAFPIINIRETGRRIEQARLEAGYSVKDVMNYLGFQNPQAIYNWQHGACLPSLDNLLALSKLFEKQMEDLLVWEEQKAS